MALFFNISIEAMSLNLNRFSLTNSTKLIDNASFQRSCSNNIGDCSRKLRISSMLSNIEACFRMLLYYGSRWGSKCHSCQLKFALFVSSQLIGCSTIN